MARNTPSIEKKFATSWTQLTRAPRRFFPVRGKVDDRVAAMERKLEEMSSVPQVDMNAYKKWYEELARDRQRQQFIEQGSPEGEAIEVFTDIVKEVKTTKITLDLGNYRLRFDEKRDAVVWEKLIGGVWTEFATAARRT